MAGRRASPEPRTALINLKVMADVKADLDLIAAHRQQTLTVVLEAVIRKAAKPLHDATASR